MLVFFKFKIMLGFGPGSAENECSFKLFIIQMIKKGSLHVRLFNIHCVSIVGKYRINVLTTECKMPMFLSVSCIFFKTAVMFYTLPLPIIKTTSTDLNTYERANLLIEVVCNISYLFVKKIKKCAKILLSLYPYPRSGFRIRTGSTEVIESGFNPDSQPEMKGNTGKCFLSKTSLRQEVFKRIKVQVPCLYRYRILKRTVMFYVLTNCSTGTLPCTHKRLMKK
jgi:hypothetical protein